VITVETSLGEVWLDGRDTGRPLLVVILGSFSEPDELHDTQERFGALDVLRLHLPGNHCPELAATSIGAFAAAFSEALATRFPGRPYAVLGVSTGGLVALSMRGAGLRQILAIDPPLLTGDAWPLRGLADRAPPGFETYLWNVLGVAPGRWEPRDYTPALAGLTAPATVIVGDVPLDPERPLRRWPSLVSEAARTSLAAAARVRLQVAAGAGHNIPFDAPLVLVDAIRATCWAAFVDDETQLG
jgi:pimeloyl-ACP methyl ester carboxylesterase